MRSAVGRTVGRTFGNIKEAWLDMLLAGGVGYVVPSYISDLGFGYLAYNNIPAYRTAMDQLYAAAAEATGKTGTDNPWTSGGLKGIAKTYGGLDAANQALKAAKSGGFSRAQLVKAALDLGFVFDGPNDGAYSGGGGNYW